MTCATRLLYLAATGRDVSPGPCRCLFCGLPHAEGDGTPSADVVKDTFTNHGLCRAPSSQTVCPACAHYFCHRWEVGQKYLAEYRKHSHHVTPDGWRSWQRHQMRGEIERLLRDGTSAPTVLVVGLSKKKHCLPLAAVNPPGAHALTVQLEEERVRVRAEDWQPLARAFDSLLALGCRKGEILSGRYDHATLRKVDVGRALALDAAVRCWRPSGLLTLLSYVTLLEDGDDVGTDEE